MSESAGELHELVATERGLPDGSATFIEGETLEEIEASASAFAKLLEERREPATNLLTAASIAKAERQRVFVASLTGRTPHQRRDERGRFASGGFDGGARPAVPLPPESHGEMLVRLLRSREADRGAAF